VSIEQELEMPRGRRKTHRGRRSRGKGPKPESHQAHALAKEHIQAAANASDPKQAHAHLFKAISALKKCQ
jgi:hypothetical protein